MTNVQTAFGVLYPYDGLIVNANNLYDAKAIIEVARRVVADGVDPLGDEAEKYRGAYIVIWNGAEWEKYE